MSASLEPLRQQIEAETAAMLEHFRWFIDPNRSHVEPEDLERMYRHRLIQLRNAWTALRLAMQAQYGHPAP